MGITHNYLITADRKPTLAEVEKAEIVVNLADGTMWTENNGGAVIKLGGTVYTGGVGLSVSAANVISHDSHTGDVTGSSVLAIAAGVVTLTKMANLAGNTFIGRASTTGVPQALTATTARSILNVADGANNTPNATATTGGALTDAMAVLLDGIEAGAEVNNISDANALDLTDGGATILHSHEATNILNFDTEVGNHTDVAASKTITDHITVTQAVNLDTIETNSNASKTITDNITVTQPVNLDDIETRVNELDSAMVLKGTWDASVGDFPDSANTTPSLSGSIDAGMSWIVSTGGTVNGVEFTADDRIIALVASASNTVYAGNWHKADYTDLVQSVKGNATTAQTGAVSLDPDDFSDAATTNKFVTAAEKTILSNTSGTNSGNQNLFDKIAVSGQSNIVADAEGDTLTFAGTGGVIITTNAGTDTVTIDASGINGTTNLGSTHGATTVDITSSSGSDTTINQAVADTTAGVMSGADKGKLDHITVTQDVDLDTMESNQIGIQLTGEAV